MDSDLFRSIILIVIIALITGTTVMLTSIELDNNIMLHNVTSILNTQTANRTIQFHLAHQLDEILANTTASNGVLIPKSK